MCCWIRVTSSEWSWHCKLKKMCLIQLYFHKQNTIFKQKFLNIILERISFISIDVWGDYWLPLVLQTDLSQTTIVNHEALDCSVLERDSLSLFIYDPIKRVWTEDLRSHARRLINRTWIWHLMVYLFNINLL